MKRIIVVEDDPSIQDAVSLILETEGYELTMMSDGQKLLNNNFDLPDLFILDKQLSGVDGLDICRFLKGQESSRNIPVIMLSANPQIEVMAKASGADDAIEKPFRIKDLKSKILKLLK